MRYMPIVWNNFSNYITDAITTCNKNGLGQKSIYLIMFLNDFPSFSEVSSILIKGYVH